MLTPAKLTTLAIVALDAARQYGQVQSTADDFPQIVAIKRRHALATRAALLQAIDSLFPAKLPETTTTEDSHGTT